MKSGDSGIDKVTQSDKDGKESDSIQDTEEKGRTTGDLDDAQAVGISPLSRRWKAPASDMIKKRSQSEKRSLQRHRGHWYVCIEGGA